MKPTKPHKSMRGHFAWYLYDEMVKNGDIYVITADLGHGMWDAIRDDFPDRFINVGAAEQAMMGIAVGLALEGKIPVCYSITTFLLYRPFETIRTYINHEKIPVIMVGGGRDKDYSHDGISHWSEDAEDVLALFENIGEYWPEDAGRMETLVPEIIEGTERLKLPSFVSLRR